MADVVSTSAQHHRTGERAAQDCRANQRGQPRPLSVVNDIRNRIEQRITLPMATALSTEGNLSEAEASKRLLLASILSFALIFMLLYHDLKRPMLAAIVMLNLPLALIGGVAAIWINSGTLSIPAIIGFITLFGIATRNGLLLISRYEALRDSGLSLGQRIVEGSRDRILPILMTALTTALALLPLVIQGDKPGNEIQSPMLSLSLGIAELHCAQPNGSAIGVHGL